MAPRHANSRKRYIFRMRLHIPPPRGDMTMHPRVLRPCSIIYPPQHPDGVECNRFPLLTPNECRTPPECRRSLCHMTYCAASRWNLARQSFKQWNFSKAERAVAQPTREHANQQRQQKRRLTLQRRKRRGCKHIQPGASI